LCVKPKSAELLPKGQTGQEYRAGCGAGEHANEELRDRAHDDRSYP
jgi:hypothetical protein